MLRTLVLAVLTPAGTCDPSLAIAASRAGELGVLDLQYCHDLGTAQAALARLAAHAHAPFGVKLDVNDEAVVSAVATSAPDLLTLVSLASVPTSTALLTRVVAQLHARGLTVLVETTNLDEARVAVSAGANGVIAKGHEAGGRIGDESTFVLLQRLLGALDVPVYAQGGIGLHTAPACYAAGAAGVFLDAQLALTRESSLPDAIKEKIATMDGSETIALGTRLGAAYRFYARPGLAALAELRHDEARLEAKRPKLTARRQKKLGAVAAEWHEAVRHRIGWGTPDDCVYPLGQDAAFAPSLAARFGTVAGVLAALRAAIPAHCDLARELRPLDEGAPLAHAHGTRYPIAQGPMTRVSDTASFASAVAEGGALPFLALALLRADEVRLLLQETKTLLGERSWGVGILGFVSPELRQEQVDVIREVRPPWALIAGGRPDQAHSLEREGIATYLHVPSPGLLRMFLADGAHRFVFEGRECGGHVGPRTSFVLWETMIDALLEARRTAQDPPIDVLFAGGIHDARSGAMVAAMAAPLVARGLRVGVLMGTAYLFTDEAVSSGTIMPGFQEEALRCTHTVLLESGPGHATRCADNAFYGVFEEERQRLAHAGAGTDEMREALEDLNLGRLRIASKGITRHPNYGQDPDAPKFIPLSAAEQRAEGMYMIGQVAALREETTTVAALHHRVSVESTLLLERLVTEGDEITDAADAPAPADVAIIGMSALLPGAQNVHTYWENILNKVNPITEVPADRWDWRRYFDEDKSARDRVYSRWGGFLDDIPFDPLSYGMPPASLNSVEPLQLLTLEAVRAALDDAGYLRRPFPRERTAVVLGASGVSDLGLLYGVRSTLPSYLDGDGSALTSQLAAALPEWTEDSFPGVLGNVAAGRVTNRFDFGGTNFTVDAACASSLAAVSQGIKELQLGTADVVVAGGGDTAQNAHSFMAFSKTHALSPRGRCRPFDATADGIAISEGVAIVILKRLADAERDGDRIYAVIKGVGSSSDGRDKSLTAPRPEGQVRALQRAYCQAGFSPATVGLIEAHGTGTVVGDKTEVASLSTVFQAAGAAPGSCAIGSVKSMIGHTKACAGVASLVKVALALYHRTLPPTLVEQPNPNAGFGENAFYVNSEARPWLDGTKGHPRRAGVSAFGFGGTNFHVALEEYSGGYLPAEPPAQIWPSELFVFKAATRETLRDSVAAVVAGLDRGARPALRDLSFSLAKASEEGRSHQAGHKALALAIVATSLDDLRAKLQTALDGLESDAPSINDPRGVYFSAQPLAHDGKIAFLFPGQGSQYVNMLRGLAVQFSEAQEAFETANASLRDCFPGGLTSYVFPQPSFSKEEADEQQARLTATRVAQPALGAAALAMHMLLKKLGVTPDMVAGHSYAEFVALHAAGVFDAEALFALSEARGRFMAESAGADDPGKMAAVAADATTVARMIEGIEGVVLANLNAPVQTVISGTSAAVTAAVDRLKAQDIRSTMLPVSAAFHSPLMSAAHDKLAEVMTSVRFATPQVAVYSNTTAQRYPNDATAITALLRDHLVSPVRFADEIEAMYEAGARVFIEVGPRNVLSGLANSILGEQPHLCVATDQPNRPGLLQLQHALAQMVMHGVPVSLERLFQGRKARRLDPRTMDERTGRTVLAATTWLVNGGYSRPLPASGNPEENRRSLVPVAQAVDREELTIDSTPADSKRLTFSGMAASSRGETPTSGHIATIAGDTEVSMADINGDGSGGGRRRETPALPHANGSTSGWSEVPTGPPAGTLTPPKAGQNGHGAAPTESVAEGSVTDLRAATGWTSAPQPLAEPVYVDELSATMMQFQQVMAQFLETQRAVMAAYFGQPAPLAPSVPAAPGPIYVAPAVAPTYLSAPAHVAPAPTYAPPPTVPPVAEPKPMLQEAVAAAPLDSPLAASPTTPAEAPIAPAPAAQAPMPAEAPALDEAMLTQQLLAIVSERTGYPNEMLDLDLDLEADLGIDSIKRVEIVGTLRRAVAVNGIPDGAMAKLSAVKTLRAIVAGMMEAVATVSTHPPPASIPTTVATPERPHNPVVAVPRFTLRATTLSVASSRSSQVSDLLPAGCSVVVTDDERGIARGVAHELRRHGYSVAVLRAASEVGELGQDTYTTSFTDPAAVAAALDAIRRRQGPIGGVVHLLPLRGEAPSWERMDLSTWKERLASDVKGLYYLAHAAGPELLSLAHGESSQPKRGLLLAAMGMGGAFGYAPTAGSQPPVANGNRNAGISAEAAIGFWPGHGGIAGFMKTVGLEWPGVLVRAVDLIPTAPAAQLIEQVLEEIGTIDDEIEVGRQESRRVILEPVASPLNVNRSAALEMDSSWVVLVTGGARGITVGVAHELAQHCRPTLLLVGRSALPAHEEASDTAGLTTPREIKAALIARMRADGEQVHPARVEAAYNRLLQDREMRAALVRLATTGATVHYYATDVRDETAFGSLIDAIYETYGRLDGVIHGAGIVEDKLVVDKVPESFDRVFDTKADSVHVLARKLRPESLKFLALFSSVTARFGNRGQADYGAANDVMNKLALDLDARWPARVVSFNWGPWGAVGEAGGGMVGAEIEAQFAQRGVELIQPEIGYRRALEELRLGHKGEVEIVYGNGPWGTGQRRMGYD